MCSPTPTEVITMYPAITGIAVAMAAVFLLPVLFGLRIIYVEWRRRCRYDEAMIEQARKNLEQAALQTVEPYEPAPVAPPYRRPD
jgi:hypothetical protein